ncbi:unnamed protein product [Allacma fusca]|uniref:Uncharacterized protein n=1 Tax=Allacma fusca TaxID=39272 RepID=A0A8J2P9X3_9HEXA|nr:unnamed protein product [Allacma fusca]
MKTYRMVQILCKRFNFVFASTFLPNITLMAVGNIILGNFGTLRFFNELDFSLYVNFPLMSCMMFLFTVTFYPSNATLKELSDWEQTHVLISRLSIEKELCTWDSEPCRQNQNGGSLFAKKPFLAAENVVGSKVGRIVLQMAEVSKESDWKGQWEKEFLQRFVNVEDKNGRHLLHGQGTKKDEDHRQIQKFGGTFRNKMDNLHRYKMAQSLARSCPFVAVRMAGFYPIKRTTALSIFDFIWCNTISTLLTWR